MCFIYGTNVPFKIFQISDNKSSYTEMKTTSRFDNLFITWYCVISRLSMKREKMMNKSRITYRAKDIGMIVRYDTNGILSHSLLHLFKCHIRKYSQECLWVLTKCKSFVDRCRKNTAVLTFGTRHIVDVDSPSRKWRRDPFPDLLASFLCRGFPLKNGTLGNFSTSFSSLSPFLSFSPPQHKDESIRTKFSFRDNADIWSDNFWNTSSRNPKLEKKWLYFAS